MFEKEKIVKIVYRNYRGEVSIREIVPIQMFFGETEYHPNRQWILTAIDVGKGQSRDFAFSDIISVIS